MADLAENFLPEPELPSFRVFAGQGIERAIGSAYHGLPVPGHFSGHGGGISRELPGLPFFRRNRTRAAVARPRNCGVNGRSAPFSSFGASGELCASQLQFRSHPSALQRFFPAPCDGTRLSFDQANWGATTGLIRWATSINCGAAKEWEQ
jgi:hypothetical protein